jgi:sulfite reductase (NADPH) hemoprotein beta-component
VARIAYLSSDVIVSVQAAQSIESEFSSHLKRYAGRKDRSLVAASESGVPEVGGQRVLYFTLDGSIDRFF